MAVLVSQMSAIPHLQSYMTNGHGQPASTGVSNLRSDASAQSGSKRPKLSLQTTALTSTYGVLTRGVASNTTQSMHTPTTTNTLANTWDLSIRPSPVLRTESPRPQPKTQTTDQPYTLSLPFGVRPILKNSPLPPRARSISASPRESKRKVFFSQPKQVVFRRNLEDFIENTKYVTPRSDLSSEEETSDTEGQFSSPSLNDHDVPTEPECSPPPSKKRKDRRDSGICIETKSAGVVTSKIPSEDNALSAEPSKNCKRRKWQWTIDEDKTLQNNAPADSTSVIGSASENDQGGARSPDIQEGQSTREGRSPPDIHPVRTSSREEVETEDRESTLRFRQGISCDKRTPSAKKESEAHKADNIDSQHSAA